MISHDGETFKGAIRACNFHHIEYCRSRLYANARPACADVVCHRDLARDDRLRLIEVFNQDCFGNLHARLAPSISAIPFLSAKQSPLLAEVSRWRVAADEFQPRDPYAVFDRL